MHAKNFRGCNPTNFLPQEAFNSYLTLGIIWFIAKANAFSSKSNLMSPWRKDVSDSHARAVAIKELTSPRKGSGYPNHSFNMKMEF